MGTYSDGKLPNTDDQGDLMLAVFPDQQRNVVHIEFGVQLRWLGLDADTARKFGAALLHAADSLDGGAHETD